jgi:DNA-binding transcriptional MerR regulator
MFTIGDFARHGRASVRMLDYYDATGLFPRPGSTRPAATGSTRPFSSRGSTASSR